MDSLWPPPTPPGTDPVLGEGWPPPVPSQTEPPRRGRAVLAAVVVGLVLLGGGIGIGWRLTKGTGTSTGTAPLQALSPVNPSTGKAADAPNVRAIADRVDPGIVDINTYTTLYGVGIGRLEPLAAGTGMVLTSSGEVLTNNHVIQGATSIRVTVPGHSGSYTAVVVGADPTDDVALLQIEGASALRAETLADSSSVKAGQSVIAIGNALGKGGSPSVTQGTVTALDRAITVGNRHGGPERLAGLIQTSASISPGDSGGAVVNDAGQVVGMITAAATSSRDQTSSTVGFAIPINTALGVVNQIRAGQGSSTVIIGKAGFLGVETRRLDAAGAAQLGLHVSSGVLVVGVVPGTPAARAGIARYSVITSVNGQRVRSQDALGSALHVHKPGEQIQVTWVDQGGTTHTATVRLITGPAV
jgi:S1-C subfamily serine protease